MNTEEIIRRLAFLGVKARVCSCGCSSLEIDEQSLDTAICKECCVTYVPDQDDSENGFCSHACEMQWARRYTSGR